MKFKDLISLQILILVTLISTTAFAAPTIGGVVGDTEWNNHMIVDYSYTYGNELYDVEKLGLWIEDDMLYIGLQTDFNLDGGRAHSDSIYERDEDGVDTDISNIDSGDFAFDFGQDGSYEAGLDFKISGGSVDSLTFFTIDTDKWIDPVINTHNGQSPWTASPNDYKYWQTGSTSDDSNPSTFKVDYAFRNDNDRDPGDAIEIAIDLNTLTGQLNTLFTTSSSVNLHWTMECGNDGLTYGSNIPSDVVPEPATLLLFGMGLLGVSAYSRKRSNKSNA